MRKVFLLLLVLITMITIAACGGQEDTSGESDKNESVEKAETVKKDEEKEETVEVDKNLLSVEVTLPASFFELEGQDIDQVIADAKEDGVQEVTKNEDGSLTYKMSKAKHAEMMKEMEEQVKNTIEEMKNSEDFVSIQDVTVNKSFSEFTMIVDREAFENSFDGFAALGLGFSGMFYQLFDGVNPDDYEVKIKLEDAGTGEVFNTIVYPEALEEQKQFQVIR